ncbi:cation-transporting P-type ATPase [Streptomyces sp. JV185]|uniref:cation-transporting P-type ATPase n=1 Tax=Streptomyces sp. JV185 TaxID=858638 RepID=UPI002E796C82|nr:cation-transporting P-type ATPase [Streptomyces sp. JV185]
MKVRPNAVGEQPRTSEEGWYSRAPEEVAAAFGVDPAVGLSAGRAAEPLTAHGPNALPEEKGPEAWRRFLKQYRSDMQIVLVAAAVVSLLIKEWTTGILLIVLTLLNAVVGLRQEGKAESAMNALKSMMKTTARVRRDGTEAEIPAEELVVGDIVLISAGDQVAADGRIIEADQARPGPLRQRRDRSVDRVHRLRPLSDRGCVRVPQRDGVGADDECAGKGVDGRRGIPPGRVASRHRPARRRPGGDCEDADERPA